MTGWDEDRERRYDKAVARFCAVALIGMIIFMCVAEHGW